MIDILIAVAVSAALFALAIGANWPVAFLVTAYLIFCKFTRAN